MQPEERVDPPLAVVITNRTLAKKVKQPVRAITRSDLDFEMSCFTPGIRSYVDFRLPSMTVNVRMVCFPSAFVTIFTNGHEPPMPRKPKHLQSF